MNPYFNENAILAQYPGAEELMYPAMLIWKLPAGKESMMSTVCSNGQYFAEEKIDGAWYQFVKGTNGANYLFGRTVSRVTNLMTEKGENVPHILSALDCLPNGTVLIGEVYYPGGTAKDTVTITGCLPEEAVRRQNNPGGRGRIHYYVHDIIFYDSINLMNTGAWDRYRILKAVWEKYNLNQYDFLRLATVVESDIEDEVSHILNSGGEGMVLKKRDAIYSPGKRPAWSAIKFKQMDDIDLVCTRCIEPTKEYTGKELDTWPYWIIEKQEADGTWSLYDVCQSGEPYQIRSPQFRTIPVTKPYALGWKSAIGIGAYDDNGNLVELGTVSSGLTDENKIAMGKTPDLFIGKVVALHCMSIDCKEKTLRHPVFKGWREDKNAADCKINEVFK